MTTNEPDSLPSSSDSPRADRRRRRRRDRATGGLDGNRVGFPTGSTGDRPGEPVGSAQRAPGAGPVDSALRRMAVYLIQEADAPPSFLQGEECRTRLRVERARADRSGERFSILLLALSREEAESGGVVESLRDQLRSMDAICDLGDGLVATLLPRTTRDGARAVMERVPCRRDGQDHTYRIVVYPDDAWDSLSQLQGEPTDPLPREDVDHDLYPLGKRILDMGLSGVGILLLSPLLIFLALWLKIVSPGPVLFHQTRVGLGGRPFDLLKFRTMHVGGAAVQLHRDHARSFIENDAPMPKAAVPLVPGGWIIRALCLDELPQLFNVLRGEMSLVGPRPCVPYEAEAYKQWHWRRFGLMPGLTGLWQVSGKNRLSFNQMVRLDLRYARQLSWMTDLAILSRTPVAIVREVFLAAQEDRGT